MTTAVLFSVPVGNVIQPYSALPALTGHLRHQGITVVQRDLGMELYDWLLSPESLWEVFEDIRRDVARLEGSGAPVSLHDQYRYLQLAKCSSMSNLVADVEAAKAALRSDRFYDPDTFFMARTVLSEALGVSSLRSRPALGFTFDALAVRRCYVGSLGAAVRFAQEERSNTLTSFYERVALPLVQQSRPDVIGIAVNYDSHIFGALSLAATLRRAGWQGRIVLGGRAISRFPDSLSRTAELFDLVDGVLLGEAEQTLTRYAELAAAGEAPDDVAGLCYRKDGEVRVGRPAFLADLDIPPAPDYSGLQLDRYFAPEVVGLYALSRGCYWNHCTFCTETLGVPYRRRSMSLVVDDLAAIAKQLGSKLVYFAVEAIEPEDCLALSNEILARGLEVYWLTDVRAEKAFDADLMKLMYKAGCRAVLMGLESANPRVLKLMHKGIVLRNVVQALDACRDAGIAAIVHTFTGFPSETREEALATAQFVLDHSDSIRGVSHSPRFFLEPGTPIWADPAKYGISTIGPANGDFGYVYHPYEVSRGMSYDEVDETGDTVREMIFSRFDSRVRYNGAETLLYFAHHGRNYGLRESPSTGSSRAITAPELERNPHWRQVVLPSNADEVCANIVHYVSEGGDPRTLTDVALAREAGHELTIEKRDTPTVVCFDRVANVVERFVVVSGWVGQRILDLVTTIESEGEVRRKLLAEGANESEIDEALEELFDANLLRRNLPTPAAVVSATV